jgi:hypothetical protein
MNGSQENSEVRQEKKEHPVFFFYMCNVNGKREKRDKEQSKKGGGWITPEFVKTSHIKFGHFQFPIPTDLLQTDHLPYVNTCT